MPPHAQEMVMPALYLLHVNTQDVTIRMLVMELATFFLQMIRFIQKGNC